ncbi:type II toxin-antitoxin system antitoxin SocA domain-containing protein [Paenibacillus sp. MABNS29]|uniref:Panacea domain-containing protein n=1 Tax=Paenibacillus sp. MABNS29 TaxID=3142627 RepID=UPI003D267FF7
MENVFNVASFFIKKGEENHQYMTHLKLQKLCYYAKAWGLAILDRAIFVEEFEAWVHGPVSTTLFQRYKNYGFNFIFSDELEQEHEFEPEIKQLLEAVWQTYGHIDAKVLEGLTHSESPWIDAREGLKDYEYSNNLINEHGMKVFYRKRL